MKALPQKDQTRLDAVVQFSDHVLEYGRDRYRPTPTPLFADGINVTDGEHVRWRSPGAKPEVISDLACQQNLFRTLTALTHLTGNPKYKDAAKAALKYHFDHLVDPSGLLQWGGHRFINLETLRITGPGSKGMVHELKNCLPFYDLMYEVNPGATARYVKAFWNAHLLNWKELYVSRHGNYGLQVGDVWAHEMRDPPPMRESPGLSFINAGNDLIYAAGTLYRLTGDLGAAAWARHLAHQYVLARNPKTGLGAYQFTQPRKVAEPADDNDTFSKYGDRTRRQFGPEFGAAALEGNLLLARQAGSLYVENALAQLQLASEMGQEAGDMLEWTRRGLVSFATHAYVPETNTFKPMFTDGTDLSGFTLKRDGYYGRAGATLQPYPATNKFLLSYTRGYLHTGEKILWTVARNIARGNGLGDLGTSPGQEVKVDFQTTSFDARALFALLDLYHATSHPDYLKLACVLGNNTVTNCSNNGYFTFGADCINAHFDAIEPLALLALQAAIEGKLDKIPGFIDGQGYINGDYEFPDGTVARLYGSDLYRLQK